MLHSLHSRSQIMDTSALSFLSYIILDLTLGNYFSVQVTYI